MILDDFDSRPGSATSLLRTIVGSSLRELGGWISIAELIRLMEAVGVVPAHTRTSVLRVKRKQLLLSEIVNGQSGYRLNPDAVAMLELGDRRIFTFRQMAENDRWCLISFSIPEGRRGERHRLRQRLSWIGCGTVADGLWICPAFLAEEAEQILADLGLREFATVFIVDAPHTAGTLAEAVSEWWDLDRLASLHRGFIASTASSASPEPADASAHPDPRTAFARYIIALDRWRILPYVDPGLHADVLPKDWPGFASLALFQSIVSSCQDAAREFVLRR